MKNIRSTEYLQLAKDGMVGAGVLQIQYYSLTFFFFGEGGG